MGQKPDRDEHANHGQGELAVIDEKTDQPSHGAREQGHAPPSRMGTNCLATLIPSHDATARITVSPRIAASAYGQCRPTPSPNQNKPKAVMRMPTTNLSEFSGTRARGRCKINPAPTTSAHAASAPRLAATSRPRTAPRPMTMTMTSIPSSVTALNAVTIAMGAHWPRESGSMLALGSFKAKTPFC